MHEPYYQGPDLLVWDNTPHNLGFSKAVNLLISKAEGEDVILMNDDVLPQTDCLERLRETAYSDPAIGMVNPKLVMGDGKVWSTGHELVQKFHLPGVLISGRADKGETMPVDVPGADLACAYVKRRMIDQIGLLDEWFFHGVEEVDWSIRARRAGWRTVYEPRALAYHIRERRKLYVKQRVMPDYYHCYAKNHLWKMLVSSMILNMAGIPAALKNRTPEYLMIKIRGLIPV